jgi:hypothetical protein
LARSKSIPSAQNSQKIAREARNLVRVVLGQGTKSILICAFALENIEAVFRTYNIPRQDPHEPEETDAISYFGNALGHVQGTLYKTHVDKPGCEVKGMSLGS